MQSSFAQLLHQLVLAAGGKHLILTCAKSMLCLLKWLLCEFLSIRGMLLSFNTHRIWPCGSLLFIYHKFAM